MLLITTYLTLRTNFLLISAMPASPSSTISVRNPDPNLVSAAALHASDSFSTVPQSQTNSPPFASPRTLFQRDPIVAGPHTGAPKITISLPCRPTSVVPPACGLGYIHRPGLQHAASPPHCTRSFVLHRNRSRRCIFVFPVSNAGTQPSMQSGGDTTPSNLRDPPLPLSSMRCGDRSKPHH